MQLNKKQPAHLMLFLCFMFSVINSKAQDTTAISRDSKLILQKTAPENVVYNSNNLSKGEYGSDMRIAQLNFLPLKAGSVYSIFLFYDGDSKSRFTSELVYDEGYAESGNVKRVS